MSNVCLTVVSTQAGHTQQRERPRHAPSVGTALSIRLSVSIRALFQFPCASVSQMCPEVTASLLYAVLAWKGCVRMFMWYIHTMEYYSARKGKKIGSFVKMWMDLETVIQGELSQKEKGKYPVLMQLSGIWKNGVDNLICKAK